MTKQICENATTEFNKNLTYLKLDFYVKTKDNIYKKDLP